MSQHLVENPELLTYHRCLCRERELAAVSITKEDVELIVQEMELDKKIAERKLREANGDVVVALRAIVAGPLIV